MALIIETEPGESVILDAAYRPEKGEPFCFGITNRAVYVPMKKTFAVSDPWYFRRIPLAEVREIRIRRLRPYALLFLAVLMIVAGLYTTIGMFNPDYARTGGQIYGWPIAITVGGFVLPFVARGRFGLVVRFSNGDFRWKPPLVVDRASKNQIAAVLNQIVDRSRSAGLTVLDERVV